MFVPYRVKNPTKRFPVVTVTLIAINVVVYAFTVDSGLDIRRNVVEGYACIFGSTPIWTLITSAFLHGDIFHLAGNMLFLWVFGPPVEDRLGRVSYPILYIVTGLAGDLLQAVIDQAVTGHARPVIGASGCIMGVVGAYWYLFPWSKVCVFYWFWWFWRGVWEIAAVWIIGLYLALDVFEGMLFGATGVSGGVADFAHVGGAVVGALMCIIMQVTRDTEDVSEAKAIHADMHDLSLLPLHALQTMLEEDPGNPDLIKAMIVPALSMNQQGAIDKAVAQAGPQLMEKAPALVAHYLVDLRGNAGIYQPVHLLRLAGQIERDGDPPKGIQLYKMIVTNCPNMPEAETALFRMAQCYWRVFKDAGSAQACLVEMGNRFPNGPMAHFGRILSQQLVQ